MPVKHIWSVICQKALVDSGTNLISLIEIVEKIDVNIKEGENQQPGKSLVLPFNFEIVSFWRRSEKEKQVEGEAKIIISSPEEKELASVPLKFIIPENTESTRTIVKINVLPLTISGEYKIEILQKRGREHITVGEIPFNVVIHQNFSN